MRINPKIFKGGFEPQVYKWLKPYKNNYKTIEYESEKINYTIRKDYWPDFVVTLKNKKKIYIECKGYFDAQSRTKMLAVKRDHPNLDIRLVFQKNNKLNKKARMTYTEWAKKHGFPCAVGEIPKEWFTL